MAAARAASLCKRASEPETDGPALTTLMSPAVDSTPLTTLFANKEAAVVVAAVKDAERSASSRSLENSLMSSNMSSTYWATAAGELTHSSALLIAPPCSSTRPCKESFCNRILPREAPPDPLRLSSGTGGSEIAFWSAIALLASIAARRGPLTAEKDSGNFSTSFTTEPNAAEAPISPESATSTSSSSGALQLATAESHVLYSQYHFLGHRLMSTPAGTLRHLWQFFLSH